MFGTWSRKHEMECRFGQLTWLDRTLRLGADRLPVAKSSPESAIARHDPSIRDFMTWVRFQRYEVDRSPLELRVFIQDALYVVRPRPGGERGAVDVGTRK